MAKVVSISYVGSSASAVKAAAEVAAANEKAAATSAAAFDASTSKIGGALNKVSKAGASFGLPFAASLGSLGSKLDDTSTKGEKFGSTLSKIGGVELLAAAAGVAVLGTTSVRAAEAFDTSQARLQTAVQNTGEAFSTAQPGVSKLDDSFVKFGFTTSQTENALSILTSATHNVAEAQTAMGAAADIARARNLDLSQVAVGLSKAAEGNYTTLSRLGIVTKEQTKNFHSFGDVLDYVGKIFGGQASAFAGTFQGKLAAVDAQANQLEVTLGNALIPKIESIAGASIGAVQGFESANKATDGWLGKLTLAGAAVPALAFASEKLTGVIASGATAASSAGQTLLGYANIGAKAVLGEDALTSSLEANTAARVENTTAIEASAGAQVGSGVGAAGAGSVGAGFAAAAPEIALFVAASLGVGAALRDIGTSAVLSDARINSLATDLQKGGASAAHARTEFAQLLGPQGATALQHYSDLLVANASANDLASAKSKVLSSALSEIPGYSKAAATNNEFLAAKVRDVTLEAGNATSAVKKLTAEYGAGAVQSATQAAAESKYRNDLVLSTSGSAGASAATKRLAGDRADFMAVNKQVASVENQINSALGITTGALGANASAATQGAFAYLGLANSVKNAADALSAIDSKAFAPIQAAITVDTDKTNVSKAIDELNNPGGSAPSSGGGSGQTAIAAALDQQQKALSVTDALRGVQSATSGVTDAETQLAQARQSNIEADQSLVAAEQNYRTTLKGVAADSLAAKTATEALTQAKNDAAGSKLDVKDAQRAVATAKSDARLNQFGVTDAQTTLTNDQQSGASSEQIVKDQVALTDARIAASAGNEAVVRAELALSDAQLAAKGKTQDLNTAQKSLNETLHGYPAKSQQAKDATNQLKDAQLAAQSSAEGVTTAIQGLQTAQDNTKSSALNLKRAQADLAGQLTSTVGAASKASGALESYQTRVDNLKTAVHQLALDSGIATAQATHNVADGFKAMVTSLSNAVSSEPILKSAFAGLLATLEQDYAKQETVISQAQAATNKNITHVPGFADGGVVPGPAGRPMLAVVHGGETVVPHAALANSRPYGSGTTEIHYHVTITGPIMGADVEKTVHTALKNITRKDGHVAGVRTA